MNILRIIFLYLFMGYLWSLFIGLRADSRFHLGCIVACMLIWPGLVALYIYSAVMAFIDGLMG